jgi:hypothetical protein
MESISDEERLRGQNLMRYASRSLKKSPDTGIDWLTALTLKSKLKAVVFRWRNFSDYLPPKKVNSVMSELQDKLDRGEITPEEYHDRWDKEMEENER